MSRTCHALLTGFLILLFTAVSQGQMTLVEQGKPAAQIIISPNPPRAVPVAARELQTYLEKISGARLPINTAPDDALPGRIYVGQSQYTHSLGIDVADLKYGAYRMLSGDHWLALVGNDSDYVFRQPQPLTREEVPKAQEAWDKITGEKWRMPYGVAPMRHYNKTLNLWYLDEKGSINAVYALLHQLGARWYLPGELGEVLPSMQTITIPAVDKTVKPDFALRYPHSRQGFGNTEEALWALRMGWNPAPDIVGPYSLMGVAHGISSLLARPESRVGKDDYYALIGGKRLVTGDNPSFCLSQEKLIDENVRFLRAVFDTYNPYMVSVQPSDGMIMVCQCPLCAGKATPERGRRGAASDYVWSYINRVAQEVYKTHPNHRIAALAYANYQLPPTKIAQLSPNIVVGVPAGRTFYHNNEKELSLLEDIRKQWLAKMPPGHKELYQYEYFMDARPGRPTQYLPVVVTNTLARNLRGLKGLSLGEHIDVERYRENHLDLATMHLNLYVTSRLWWNVDEDLDAMLQEYYTLYYGPASEEMKATLLYAQDHWPAMPNDPKLIETFFTLLAKAQAKVTPESVYGQRIKLIADYTAPMENLRQQQISGRDESIPPVELRGPRPSVDPKTMVIDGKFDEPVWQHVSGPGTPERLNLKTYKLSDLITGKAPRQDTTFKVFWTDDALYFAITCFDSDMAHLPIGTQTNDDNAIWQGDLIELHLETQSHSYYALVINPAGAMNDLDWKNKTRDTAWSSGAEVATQRLADRWNIEMRIPVISRMEGDIVELGGKGVIGSLPTRTYPWYMNMVRQRLRKDDNEFTAYSPLGKKGFHDPTKFARLSKAK